MGKVKEAEMLKEEAAQVAKQETNDMEVTPAFVKKYLTLLQKRDAIIDEVGAMEATIMAHVEDTGEMVICNLLKVSVSKTPPKFIATTEGGKVTEAMKQNLIELLKETVYVKTATSLEGKKVHEAKDTDKKLKAALKKVGMDTSQDEKIGFDRLVKAGKK